MGWTLVTALRVRHDFFQESFVGCLSTPVKERNEGHREDRKSSRTVISTEGSHQRSRELTVSTAKENQWPEATSSEALP